MPTCAFELDRFTADDQRLEVSGRWIGLRGRRFVRPSLTVFIDGHSTRALAELEHKPWAAEEGDEWVAAFPWRGELDEIEEFELAVAPDLSVRLPWPTESIEELVLPVVPPEDQARPARSGRAPEPPRGEAQELREQADAVRHNALAVRDRALADLDEAVGARDRLRAELEQVAADRGRLCAELDYVAGEVDRLRAELTRALAERNRAIKDRDRMGAEREQGPPLAPPTPVVPLPPRRAELHRPRTWGIRVLAVALIVAVLVVALIVVVGSGPASVAP